MDFSAAGMDSREQAPVVQRTDKKCNVINIFKTSRSCSLRRTLQGFKLHSSQMKNCNFILYYPKKDKKDKNDTLYKHTFRYYAFGQRVVEFKLVISVLPAFWLAVAWASKKSYYLETSYSTQSAA